MLWGDVGTFSHTVIDIDLADGLVDALLAPPQWGLHRRRAGRRRRGDSSIDIPCGTTICRAHHRGDGHRCYDRHNSCYAGGNGASTYSRAAHGVLSLHGPRGTACWARIVRPYRFIRYLTRLQTGTGSTMGCCSILGALSFASHALSRPCSLA